MFYVVNSQDCAEPFITYRNAIFTAITRSRAWVRILGVGKSMNNLIEEINSCIENDYTLKFKYPTPEELTKIRAINFDAPKKRSKKSAKKSKKFSAPELSADKIIEAFEQGKLSTSDLEKLSQYLK